MKLKVALLLLLLQGSLSASEDPRVQEIEALKRQVQALQAQNQEMMKALEAMQARLGGAPAPPPAAPPAPSPLLPKVVQIGESSTLKFYGFLRMDAIYDTQVMDRTIVPMYVRSPDSGAPAAVRSRRDETAFSLDPRLTRLGMDFDGGTPEPLGYAKLTGKLEMDFDTTLQSESRQVPRIRHAFIRTAWPSDYSLQLGQASDVISPLFPSVQAHSGGLWNAGNLGDRRPQVIASYDPRVGPGKLSLTGSIGLAGAVVGSDTDASNTIDGSQSGAPMFQWRTGYARPLWVEMKDFSIGFWGHHSSESSSTAIFGENRWPSESLGADVTLPITKALTAKGEIWRGRNLPDVRGGITQGIDAWGRVVGSEGGWCELGYRFSDRYTLLGGWSVDNPGGDDVLDQAGARTKNEVTYLGNRFSFGRFDLGIDFMRWETQYKDTRDGFNNRVSVFTQFNF